MIGHRDSVPIEDVWRISFFVLCGVFALWVAVSTLRVSQGTHIHTHSTQALGSGLTRIRPICLVCGSTL